MGNLNDDDDEITITLPRSDAVTIATALVMVSVRALGESRDPQLAPTVQRQRLDYSGRIAALVKEIDNVVLA